MGDSTEMASAPVRGSWRRPLLAAALAGSALALAVASSFAIEHTRTTYAWGIPEAPQTPAGQWRPVAVTGAFTPLLLAAPPFLWDVQWSCGVDLPPGDDEPLEVFASIVRDEHGPGLRVTLIDGSFDVVVGGEVVATAPASLTGSPDCPYRFTLDDGGAWSLTVGDQGLAEGAITARPRVNGFGSELDGDGSTGRVGVVVTTQRHGSTRSGAVRATQAASVVFAALAVACLLWAWRAEERTESGPE